MRNRLSSAELAIWGLNCLLIAGGALLLASRAGAAHPVITSMRIPFWGLLIGFAAAERFVVHIHFRRSAHSMSLGEIPLVFGLLFASGHDVILAGAVGRLLVLALHRKLPPIRLAFNLGQFLLGSSIAVLVFHGIAVSGTQIDPIVWFGALLAVASNSLTAVLLIGAVVSLSEESLMRPRQFGSMLLTDLAVVVANTSIALSAATLVFHDWKAGVLMLVPIAGMFVTYRAYIHERQRHARLEFLYEAARALSHSPEIGPALEKLLAQAVEAFRAEVAEIIFLSPDRTDALRTTIRASGPTGVLETVEPVIAEQLRGLIESQDVGACAMSDISDGELSEYLRSRGLGDGIFAVLKGERCIGAMMIGHPSGVVDNFSPEDLKLFETLAHNTTVALENDRLGHAVWQMKELQRELRHQASHDPLTDLANRSLFGEAVGEALDSSTGSVSVIFIDVDDFKTVNDSLGHAAGDELLIAVAGRLRDCVRPSDVVARLGGDEFAILLSDVGSPIEAIEVTERVIHRLAERFSVGGHNISVRASAGIATGDRSGIGPDELVRNADVAMYRAKQAGKHGYELFEPGMEVSVLRRHGLKQRLREAVREESFAVHYQPIISLDSGDVVACEALVRWLDGPRGPVHPQYFVPIAEEMGVIVPIGRLVLQKACEDAQRWRRGRGRSPAVHVNLSPVELRDRGFLAGVSRALERSGLRPDKLVLEVTENVVLHDPEKSIATLHELRNLGVGLALDDFGTGYSSLSHLRSLPIDWLKIGKPFVDGLEQDGFDRSFIGMILQLASRLDMDVVAEGIESQGQLASLRELGCGYGQGFYLGTPAALGPTGSAPLAGRVPELSAA